LPAYKPFLKAQQQIGGDAFFKTSAPGSPLHSIMYDIMGIDTFSTEWAERRDRVIALHDAMVENQRDIYSIVAESPAMIVQCGGNYAPEVLGKQRFIDYVLPHWEEVNAILHKGGKLVGCHLDANNKLWAKEVGESQLDWIEAFSPYPDTDMTVAEARNIWPEKVLFINFPSAVHLEEPRVIEETTKQILKEAAPGDRFIIGITENVPDSRWRESFHTILKTVNKFGRLPIK
jgi:uroporphyrinogen-III decarboxylase